MLGDFGEERHALEKSEKSPRLLAAGGEPVAVEEDPPRLQVAVVRRVLRGRGSA